jgi:hypothetical protein
MRSLIQFAQDGLRGVAAMAGDGLCYRLAGVRSTLELAQRAMSEGRGLAELATELAGDVVDLATAELLVPIDTPDAAHILVSGTGLTHLGSAEGRDKMHKAASGGGENLTDSMRMFVMGLNNGKPADGAIGVQPEWFYKGDGSILVAGNAPLIRPHFAGDGGEEPEVAGVYLIGPDGLPHRLGFVLGNEFSDHVTERVNYLWLAPSKLRQAALGAELLLGELPQDLRGTSQIRRDGTVIWQKAFLSGEANMSHSVANLEHHHFKYAQFRHAGQVHVHFFGTATLSCADGIETQAGDIFEISADGFRLGLTNVMVDGADAGMMRVKLL